MRHLLASSAAPAARLSAAEAEASFAFFMGPMLDGPQWINDVLHYLPREFRFRGNLFLTVGYDIGVALASNASLNGAHPHFDGHPASSRASLQGNSKTPCSGKKDLDSHASAGVNRASGSKA